VDVLQIHSLIDALVIFAQQPVPKAGPVDDGLGGFLSNPFMLLPLILILFWFMVLLPNQRRERRERENLLNALKKNDEVLTNAGIIGIVANVKDTEVSLKIDENTRMRVLKSAIVKILTTKEVSGDNAEASKK